MIPLAGWGVGAAGPLEGDCVAHGLELADGASPGRVGAGVVRRHAAAHAVHGDVPIERRSLAGMCHPPGALRPCYSERDFRPDPHLSALTCERATAKPPSRFRRPAASPGVSQQKRGSFWRLRRGISPSTMPEAPTGECPADYRLFAAADTGPDHLGPQEVAMRHTPAKDTHGPDRGLPELHGEKSWTPFGVQTRLVRFGRCNSALA